MFALLCKLRGCISKGTCAIQQVMLQFIHTCTAALHVYILLLRLPHSCRLALAASKRHSTFQVLEQVLLVHVVCCTLCSGLVMRLHACHAAHMPCYDTVASSLYTSCGLQASCMFKPNIELCAQRMLYA
jgi:hypothetical protein